ncbi:MAG: phosphatase PAP2 family protein [Gemella haemolysans]|uniref:phosphatase PAP2 family protein n=1 Tax=Gemella haemolysans TaxID=1379 RepID=UPI00291369A1|nr:phosphatase PAP2 family protein [Gemella haemolysans]MDU6573640.1 phosphatase PAP2 family protein [Gemella haemolysans]
MTKRKQINLVIFFIGIFILAASGYNSFLKSLDNTIINFIQGLENPMLTSIYLNTTNIADMKQSVVITVIIVIILFASKYKREALFLTLTMGTCGVVMAFIKTIFNRPRPNIHRLVELNSLSFPSGHSTSATILYLSLALIFIKLMKKNTYTTILVAIAGILFIVSSRIYLGVHYPTDTIAGISLGSAIVLIYNLIYYSRE